MGRSIELKENELEAARDEANKRFQYAPTDMNWNEFNSYMEEVSKKVCILSREYRMTKEPVFERKIPTYGSRMKLSDFIEDCESGGFIDYDGSGNYVRDNMESDIDIYPSDIKHNSVRKDFTEIVWYNR